MQVIASHMVGLPNHFAFFDKFTGEQMLRKQEYVTRAIDCLPSVSITAVSANGERFVAMYFSFLFILYILVHPVVFSHSNHW